jgi:hypothetical protein
MLNTVTLHFGRRGSQTSGRVASTLWKDITSYTGSDIYIWFGRRCLQRRHYYGTESDVQMTIKILGAGGVSDMRNCSERLILSFKDDCSMVWTQTLRSQDGHSVFS